MLHPSYTDLIRIVNSESEGDTPVVNSRYSIVMAAAKRARQIVAGEANVTEKEAQKPLSTAVKELAEGKITILPDDAPEEDEINIVKKPFLAIADDEEGELDENEDADAEDEEETEDDEEDEEDEEEDADLTDEAEQPEE